MPGANGFYPPEQYSPVWVALGLVLLLLIAAWIVFVFRFTRRRPEPVAADPLAGFPLGTEALRTTYLGLIDDVERANAAGILDFRQSHQRLSLIVREFAAQARGIRAQYMTLEELRATKLTPLSTTIGELYPAAFSGQESGSLATAAEHARKLVRQWQ